MTEEWAKKSIDALKKTYTHQNPVKEKPCEFCLKNFLPRRKTSRFCSNKCSANGTPRTIRDKHPVA